MLGPEDFGRYTTAGWGAPRTSLETRGKGSTVAKVAGRRRPSAVLVVGVGGAAAPGGERVGPYRLVEKRGEGGMGVVYKAEQDRPVRRTVALKVVKPGMDSAQVIARFEAERQALAMMDHPNIARVLDAG